MAASMGERWSYSQFPYPLQNEVIFQRCQLKCGKLNTRKTKNLVISRNCLYYYSSTTVDSKECLLPTGVLPLVHLQFPEKRLIQREKCEVIVKSTVDKIAYIRILNEKEIKGKEKKEFCFIFGMYKVTIIHYPIFKEQ